MKLLIVLFLLLNCHTSSAQGETERWNDHSRSVTITRDIYGIPHIKGNTDADAVFGLMYAQCEDDFARVEENYLEKLGRISEIKGSAFIYQDLQNKIMYDTAEAKNDFEKAEPWLRKLLYAFADGINYYIKKNPSKPRILHHFEPWFPILWTDGSIGAASTGGITTEEFTRFFKTPHNPLPKYKSESNGIAYAPSLTRKKNAILYINPHVTFYFRPEVHVKSNEGLNVYGAVTWGQFFIYQGFNEFCGWMHTSSDVDVADVYALKVRDKEGNPEYFYDNNWIPLTKKEITVHYREGADKRSRNFIIYGSHHGPVMAERNGKWLALKAGNRMMNGLIQSFTRTKARSYEDFTGTLSLKANPSNNTVYADRDGNIAYWHGNFIPKRDTSIDWSAAVDGSVSSTMWKGLHEPGELISVKNPANGWIQNCNSTPFTVAGKNSPDSARFPYYMSPEGDNFRGEHVVQLLKEAKQMDLEKSWNLGYSRHIPVMKVLLPSLVNALRYDNDPEIKEAITYLQSWNMMADTGSIAQSIAIEWVDRLGAMINALPKTGRRDTYYEKTYRFAQTVSEEKLSETFRKTLQFMEAQYGTWKVSWGSINRFQRTPGKFNDSLPFYKVPFVTSVYGMLPSFTSIRTGTKFRYGYHGNSFVCAVSFGKKINAIALLAGGQSGDPASPHYFDQGKMYAEGRYRKVLFYDRDIRKHKVRSYHP